MLVMNMGNQSAVGNEGTNAQHPPCLGINERFDYQENTCQHHWSRAHLLIGGMAWWTHLATIVASYEVDIEALRSRALFRLDAVRTHAVLSIGRGGKSGDQAQGQQGNETAYRR